MKKLLLLLAFTLVLSGIPASAFAVEYGGLGGKPANPREDNPRSESIFIYELEPGESYDDGVEIVNSTGERKIVNIGVVDSVVASDGSFACAQESEPKTDVGSWIKLSRTSVTLDSGKTEVVDFTVTAPKNASTGEHGGCITIQEGKSPEASTGTGVVLSFRSAIRVAVTIPGDIVKAVSIGGVILKANTNDETQYTIQPSLTNSGNVSLDTEITSNLVSLFGIQTASRTSSYPLLPGSTARWDFDVDRPFWGGLYRADVIASYNSNTAESLGQTDKAETQTTSASSSFVFITPAPIALLIELLLLIGLVVLVVIAVRRLRHRKVVKKHWRHHTIVEGDSLQKIAKHYHVSWKKLATANKIRAPYHLEPGTKIKVPPRSAE